MSPFLMISDKEHGGIGFAFSNMLHEEKWIHTGFVFLAIVENETGAGVYRHVVHPGIYF